VTGITFRVNNRIIRNERTNHKNQRQGPFKCLVEKKERGLVGISKPVIGFNLLMGKKAFLRIVIKPFPKHPFSYNSKRDFVKHFNRGFLNS